MSDNATKPRSAGPALAQIGYAQKIFKCNAARAQRNHEEPWGLNSDPAEICSVEFQVNLTRESNALNAREIQP